MLGLLRIALTTGLAAHKKSLFAVTFVENPRLQPASLAFLLFHQGFTQN